MDWSNFCLPMWEPLQRYSALPSEARKLFCRASLLGPLIRVSLRFRGYNKTRQWLQGKLDRLTVPALALPEVSDRLDVTCRMVRAAEHYLPVRVSCLEESLVLWYLLQTQGIAAAIRIGVRKPAGTFEAHAWVEQDGIALNQTDEQHRHYHPFDHEGPSMPTDQP